MFISQLFRTFTEDKNTNVGSFQEIALVGEESLLWDKKRVQL